MAEGLTGNLAQMPLVEMLQMLIAARQSGRLEVADRAERGVIYLHDGEIVHAVEGPDTGEAAFYNLLLWTAGQFRFEAQVAAPEVSVGRPTADLLAEGRQHAAEREAVREAIPSTDRMARLNTRPPDGDVTLSPLEWELVVTLGTGREVAALAGLTGIDEFTVLRALSRLVKAGLVEIEQPATAAAQRQTAGADFFRVLVTAAATALGPMAQVIIDEEVAGLGFTREAFPADRVSSLVERVGAEIFDDEQRVVFQQTLLAVMRRAA